MAPMSGVRPAANLGANNAVAAIICREDGWFVLQHRDNIAGIWYPDHWGFFGGAVNEGESPLEALRREIKEEIGFDVRDERLFVCLDFDLTQFGLARYYRNYYVVPMTLSEYATLELHEGQGFDVFPPDVVLRDLRVTPYDAFAMYLYRDRHRIGRGWLAEDPGD
jgi:8-oxo-dGTP pyrophosphatase MutT (NUDIX family)